MTSYTDISLINCNRSSSVEARSNSDTNPAIFTNTLQETIKLNAGDKISLEHSFISEVGAGNSQTIEFKGKAKGLNKVGTYTNIDYGDKNYVRKTTYDPNYRLGYYRSVTTNEVTGETTELKDNEAPLIIGYYITSNEYPNYIQQPRSFAQSHDTRGTLPTNPTHYTSRDGGGDGFNIHTINPNHVPFCDWRPAKAQSNNDIYKQRVDNNRYTLFIKKKIRYSADLSDAHEQFPKKYHNGIFQEGIYYRVREKIDIKVNKGFNTPTAIAEQITRQLTETKNPDIFTILDADGHPREITKLVETKTYKPINSQNIYNFNSALFTGYRNATLPVTSANNTQELTDYIATFGYIAVKRPEIFEAGRIMANAIVPNTIEQHTTGGAIEVPIFPEGEAFEGFQSILPLNINIAINPDKNATDFFYSNIPYTQENCEKIRDFFDTQILYPELWDDLSNTENYKTAVRTDNFPEIGDTEITPDKTRFFHMNQYDNKLLSPTQYQNTFGDDGFTSGGSANLNTQSKATVPVFCRFKEEMRNTFIPYKDYEEFIDFEIQLMYGFCVPKEVDIYDNIGAVSKKVIIAFRSELPRTLFTTLNPATGYIRLDRGRRFGFDFHSTAFSTAIITPFSGYSNCDIGTAVKYTNSANAKQTDIFPNTCNFIPNTITTTTGVDLSPYMTMTYVGANTPVVGYNSTNNRFEFARLHTANNIGNKLHAGDKLSQINSNTLTPPNDLTERKIEPPLINGDAGDTVYKICPRPPQFGYSPTFKPYYINNQAYRIAPYPNSPTAYHGDRVASSPTGMNTHYFEGANGNIDKFAVFDSHGGIYIDNWGYDEDNWEDSLWDILGFDYYAVSSPATADNVLTRRVNNDNITKLYRPTTNCELVATDTKILVGNQFNANMYYTSLPFPVNVVNYNVQVTHGSEYKWIYNNSIGQPLEYSPQLAIKTQSMSITATDLQKSVLKPYYTIRSSLLEGHTAIGGNPTGAHLPIISVVDKYSAQGDYFFGNPSGLIFTITKPTIVSDITTEICDPDGEYSNVNDTSAVIYKIEKRKIVPTDILQDLLEEGEKEKKKK